MYISGDDWRLSFKLGLKVVLFQTFWVFISSLIDWGWLWGWPGRCLRWGHGVHYHHMNINAPRPVFSRGVKYTTTWIKFIHLKAVKSVGREWIQVPVVDFRRAPAAEAEACLLCRVRDSSVRTTKYTSRVFVVCLKEGWMFVLCPIASYDKKNLFWSQFTLGSE